MTDALAAAESAQGQGVAWSLQGQRDLDVNVVRLPAGGRLAEHRNDEVDVLVVVAAGEGEVTVDGLRHALGPGVLAFVPKGTVRSVAAGRETLVYVSTHRRRAGLGIGPTPPRG